MQHRAEALNAGTIFWPTGANLWRGNGPNSAGTSSQSGPPGRTGTTFWSSVRRG